jgi:hypothetical protein
MSVPIDKLPSQKLTIKRIGTGTWVVRPMGALDHRSMQALRFIYASTPS